MIKIILASSSPRREALLKQVGVCPEILKPDVDESMLENEGLTDFLERVTVAKGRSVVDKSRGNCLYISSDTVVVKDGSVIGKPVDRDDATNILRFLSDSEHQVKTGISLIWKGEVYYGCETTSVKFCQIPEKELQFYLDHENYSDKAGAYAIQGLASLFISSIDGCYFNVMGFPLNLFARLLKEAGIWEQVYFRW